MTKMPAMFLLVACAAVVAQRGVQLRAAEIRHRFLAVDESRGQLLYVDEADASKGWTLKLSVKHRDLQLVGRNRVLLSTPDGYREYDLADRRLVKEVKGYAGGMSARRLQDGRTILACNTQGVTFYEFDRGDQLLRQANFPGISTRVVRLTPQGTLLFGSGSQVYEGDLTGKVLQHFSLPEGAWAYQSLRLPNGHLLVAGGYHTQMYELDADGKVARTIGGQPAGEAQSLGLHLFAGFQILNNGDMVVCNWTGHGAQDSSKGVQILQYNAAGQLVWKWHDPAQAGTINGAIIMDDLDPAVLNDDASSVLRPVR
jgi:hypothetical protein